MDEGLLDYILGELEILLRDYLIVRGMPEVVSTWFKTKDLKAVYEKQDHILFGYENDF